MGINILVKSHGCSANLSDGEAIKGMLKNADFTLADENTEEIAVTIHNICTVKGDKKALNSIKETITKRPHAYLIVTGCIPPSLVPKLKELKENITIVNTHNLRDIVSAVEETLHDNPQIIVEPKRKPKILLDKIRNNSIIGIVPISNGCLGKCTYCSVKLIKGKLYSYPPDLIIKEVETCIKDGCKEIWITAQDTASYGEDIGTNLTELLQKVTEIPGDFMIRLGMANPQHIKEHLDKLIEILKNPKVYKFVHIPLQSGNNKILKAMKREYTSEEFREMIAKIKKEIPEITIATDVIVGFPGETTEQFYETVKLIQEIQPSVLNISRFRPRPDTAAANMKDQIEKEEAKDRSRKMTTAFDFAGFDANKKWKAWQGEALIVEKCQDNTMKARNYAYRQIIIPDSGKIGEKIKVKITGFSKHYLRGERVI